MSDVNKILEDLEGKRKEVLGHFNEWRELFPDFKRIALAK